MGNLALEQGAVEVDGRRLFSSVEFSVRAGEAIAFRAPSGAGKTTLLRAIATLTPLAFGTLTLGGESPEAVGFPAWRRRCVYLAQRPLMLPGSLRDNLERAFGYQSSSSSFELEQAAMLLDALGLATALLEREARTLSVGEQQRAALMRALLVRPSFLLLDEPTSALDPDSTAGVESLLQRYRADGLGLILVSHDARQIEAFGATLVTLPKPSAGSSLGGSA